MLSVTQVQNTKFRAGRTAKNKITPDIKQLGVVNRFLLPRSDALNDTFDGSDGVEEAIVDEAVQLTCRVAMLTKTAEEQSGVENAHKTTQLPDEMLSSLIAHCLPIEADKIVRQRLVEETDEFVSDDDEDERATAGVTTITCHDTVKDFLWDTTRIVHDWSDDVLLKGKFYVRGRTHISASLVHPCCRGSISVHSGKTDNAVSSSSSSSSSSATEQPLQKSAPIPAPAPQCRFSVHDLQKAASNLLKVDVAAVTANKAASPEELLKRELVERLSQMHRDGSAQKLESIDQRIEEQRQERIQNTRKEKANAFSKMFGTLAPPAATDDTQDSESSDWTSDEDDSCKRQPLPDVVDDSSHSSDDDTNSHSSSNTSSSSDSYSYEYSYEYVLDGSSSSETDSSSSSETDSSSSSETDSSSNSYVYSDESTLLDYANADLDCGTESSEESDDIDDDSSVEPMPLYEEDVCDQDDARYHYLFTYTAARGENPASVQVIGTFNNWDLDNAFSLSQVEDSDIYMCVAFISPGHHNYKFVVDGECRLCATKPFVVDENNEIYHYCFVEEALYSEEEASDVLQDDSSATKQSSWADFEDLDALARSLPEDQECVGAHPDARGRRSSVPSVSAAAMQLNIEEAKECMYWMKADVDIALRQWQNVPICDVDYQLHEVTSDTEESSSSSEYDFVQSSGSLDDSTDSSSSTSSSSSSSIDISSLSNDRSVNDDDSSITLSGSYELPEPVTAQMQTKVDCMIAICDFDDDFVFFKSLSCPYVLQWADSKRNRMHIFRRFFNDRYTWKMQRDTAVYFQLIATVALFA